MAHNCCICGKAIRKGTRHYKEIGGPARAHISCYEANPGGCGKKTKANKKKAKSNKGKSTKKNPIKFIEGEWWTNKYDTVMVARGESQPDRAVMGTKADHKNIEKKGRKLVLIWSTPDEWAIVDKTDWDSAKRNLKRLGGGKVKNVLQAGWDRPVELVGEKGWRAYITPLDKDLMTIPFKFHRGYRAQKPTLPRGQKPTTSPGWASSNKGKKAKANKGKAKANNSGSPEWKQAMQILKVIKDKLKERRAKALPKSCDMKLRSAAAQIISKKPTHSGLSAARSRAVQILDELEDHLEMNNITVPALSGERTGSDDETRLFGTPYYELEDEITGMLEKKAKSNKGGKKAKSNKGKAKSNKGSYHCSKCNCTHRNTSKVGKAHKANKAKANSKKGGKKGKPKKSEGVCECTFDERSYVKEGICQTCGKPHWTYAKYELGWDVPARVNPKKPKGHYYCNKCHCLHRNTSRVGKNHKKKYKA